MQLNLYTFEFPQDGEPVKDTEAESLRYSQQKCQGGELNLSSAVSSRVKYLYLVLVASSSRLLSFSSCCCQICKVLLDFRGDNSSVRQ
jgi:hypothetical protein